MNRVYDDLSLSQRMTRIIGQRAQHDKILIIVLMFVTIAITIFSMYYLKGFIYSLFIGGGDSSSSSPSD